MESLKLFHIPLFRSTRALHMYRELFNLYGEKIPELEIHIFEDAEEFRNNKPEWFLDMNPNGKIPVL